MNKLLIICDRLMYGALLMLVFVFPYSFALIEACQITMIVGWIAKHFLLAQTPVRRSLPQGFNFAPDSMIWPLIAIALLIVLTIPFSHCPPLSIKKFFSRFLQQIILMYLVTQIIYNRKRLYSVLLVLLITLFFVMVDVMVQYISGKSIIHHSPLIYGRVSGPMNHPNDLGTLLVTVLPVVLVLAMTSRKGWRLLVISTLFLLLVNALGLTDSRGAWIAFVVSMIALGFLLKRPKWVVIIILMLAVFLGVYGKHFLSTRTDINNAPALKVFSNSSDRYFYWGTAVRVIKHDPWFGCGYSAYVQALRDLHVGHEEYPHNSLFQITAELGIVGLILYGWFFTTLFLQIKNVLRAVSFERDLFLLACGISSGILAWMIHGLLDTGWASLQLSVLWWLLIGVLLCLGFNKIKEGESTCPCP